MKKVLLLHKQLGETPLEALTYFQEHHREYVDETLCYAGRLDPQAEGLLLVLVGDECQKREEYQNLEKQYEFSVLFGIETDTYDVMGMVTHVDARPKTVDEQAILDRFAGVFEQETPPYSSATVEGKPLYWWARQGRLAEIALPKKQIVINELEIYNARQVQLRDLVPEIIRRVQLVNGDFRQEEIVRRWHEIESQYGDASFPLLQFRIRCSSGTYVRALAHEMGKPYGGALAYSIKRTAVGRYILSDDET